MADVRRLHDQHRAILTIATDLLGLGGELRTREDATEARLLVERLDRVLSLHLEQEDQSLYPAMIASGDADARSLALDCVEGMGGLAQVWRDYLEQWTTAAIVGDPKRFACATSSLMAALASRIDREERQLYPLAEHLSAGEVRVWKPHRPLR